MRDLSEELIIDGLWWVGDDSKKGYGKLTVQPNKPILLQLVAESETFYEEFRDRPLSNFIKGNIARSDQQKATLVNPYRTGNSPQYSNGISVIEFACEILILGNHYDTLDEIVFNSMSIEFTDLERWIDDRFPFNTDINLDGTDIIHEAKYVEKEAVKLLLDELDMDLSFKQGLIGNNGSHEIIWHQAALMEIEPKAEQSFMWFWRMQQKLKNLLALLIGRPIYAIRYSAIYPVKDDIPSLRIFIDQGTPLDYLHSDVSSHLMLFPLSGIRDDIESIILSWFEKQDILETMAELMLSVLYNRHNFGRFEFLSLIQALEGFHRTKHGDNKYTLRARLDSLLDDMPLELKFSYGLNQSKYIGRFVKTRNYFSHYMNNSKDVFLEREELLGAIKRLIYFSNIVLFQELGFTDERIKQALQKVAGYGLWWRGSNW